jgi:hypothetical protein
MSTLAASATLPLAQEGIVLVRVPVDEAGAARAPVALAALAFEGQPRVPGVRVVRRSERGPGEARYSSSICCVK